MNPTSLLLNLLTLLPQASADETSARTPMPSTASTATTPADVTPISVGGWIERIESTAGDSIRQYGLNVIFVLIILGCAWVASGWVRRGVERGLTRARVEITLVKFASSVAQWGILVLAVISCLGIFGVQTASFAAVIAALGLAIGLAWQGTLSNFSSGVMLLLFRPFKVNDVIAVSGYTGTIFEIDLFTTKMDTFDNRRVILPNSKVFGEIIENMSHHQLRRVEVAVGVDYAADIDLTREVLTKAAGDTQGIVPDPAPLIRLNELAASSVNWSVFVWCERTNLLAVKADLVRRVKNGLTESGLNIPYPQMEIMLKRKE